MLEVKTYVKRPVAVEAVQFTDDNKNRVHNWCREIQGNVFATRDENGQPALMIPTAEGEMICRIGDFVIKEPFPTPDRRLYPCKADVFEQTYVAASLPRYS